MQRWLVNDKITFTGVIVAVISLIVGFYQYKTTQRNNEVILKIGDSDYERYWNAKYDFSIDKPKNWIISPSADARDGFVCSHPTEDIEIRVAGAHFDRIEELEIFNVIDNNQFQEYDFERELIDLRSNKNVKILQENRVRKSEQFKDGKYTINSEIPAKFITYKYYDESKKKELVKTMLMIAGNQMEGEMDYEIVFVDASIDSSVEFYEANKDIFSRIVLSLNFGQKKL